MATDVCIAGNSAVDGVCGDSHCVCALVHADDFFGPIISSYSRAQAVEDGVLVDLATFSFRPGLTVLQEAGIRFPVAITAAAYARTIQDGNEPLPPCQDLSGRMWDVVYMLRLAMLRSEGQQVTFPVFVNNWTGSAHKKVKAERVELKAIIGPGDDAAPVITVMLPNED